MENRDNVNVLVETLTELVELPETSSVAARDALDTVRRVNPALTPEYAQALVIEADSRGKGFLSKSDFGRLIHVCLQNTDAEDAERILQDHIYRERAAFRKRYLMYDAPVNTPPPGITENLRTMSMFREIFDSVCFGVNEMPRQRFRELVEVLLKDYKSDAKNVCKAALGDENDNIGFFEFVMVMQPSLSRHCLSDMVICARRAFQEGGVASPDRRALRSSNLQREVDTYKSQEEVAQRKFSEILGSKPTFTSIPELPSPPEPLRSYKEEEQQGELARLKLELESLRHELVMARSERPSIDVQSRGSFAETDRIEELERQLRLTKGQLALAQGGSELLTMLRRTDNTSGALKFYFPDENALVSRHRCLLELLDNIDRNEDSPYSTLLAQYELLVRGYQTLYRSHRRDADEHTRPRSVPSVDIVPESPLPPSPSVRRTPSRNVTPMSWNDIDQPPSAEKRGTGTLQDPLLTDSERLKLRARIAEAMRKGGRHYIPANRSQDAPQRFSTSGIATSQEAVERLQRLSAAGAKSHFL